MLKAVLLLAAFAAAGILAARSLGSPPAAAPTASHAVCKLKPKTRCAKPKTRTVTVKRTRTVTSVATTTETVSTTQTETVTTTTPYLVPRIGVYHGTLTSGQPFTFEIRVRPGGFVLHDFYVTGDIVLSCMQYGSRWRGFDALGISPAGHFAGAEAHLSIAGDVSADGHASGSATFSFQGTTSSCTSDPIAWSASL